ncbi:pentatricopeptide repeat-containing protein At4g13650-like [Salvia splendens]|uniref:pentatricopeptide repeat-containing protein At4g13650-like n=1 Tax=Salvia splendens TaxID=180675 RepID=UPI001C267565|nr:pentatricopeptide repeat-containing protein At4g13650-like [Salvia splendens]XP_042033325.1 pentatricopeptide repeat-containing protein At4g13650-like [Salvia splendens]XP_042033326.1 pentatricopeptide repeat-containing protein At4g13650-like [Salvia splendens]
MLLARRGYFAHFSLQRLQLVASVNFLNKEIRKIHRTYDVGALEQCLDIIDSIDGNKIEGGKSKTELCENGEVSECRNSSFYEKTKSFYAGRDSHREVFTISRELDKIATLEDDAVFNILQACIGAKVSFHFIQLLHAKIICCGSSKIPHVCNPLINLYLKNECVDSAVQVFKNMRARDSVSWVAMISGLSRNCHELESIQLYSEMRRLGVYPTPYVFSSILSACTKISLYRVGQQLHALVCKWGFSSQVYVCNSLLSLYSRCGYITSAELVFSEMKQRDKVSYNTLISGFSMHGSVAKSVELFEKMQTESLKPDSVTVASLLGSCASMGNLNKGMQLHSYAIKAGICVDIIIEGSLLDLYVKCSDVKTAHKLFLAMQTDNVVLWNMMLVAYGQLGDLHESFNLFSRMQIKGLKPNQYTYPSILRTCTSVGELDLGQQVHTQAIKTGFQPNVYVCSVLIDMYAKNGELETAIKILRRLNEDDLVSWTAMISGYTQHDMFAEAIKLFEEMQERGIQSDNIGLASAISACAGIQALKQGRQIHSQSIVSGFSSDISVGNALVCLYARCGCIQEAHLTFEKMHSRDNVTWNGLISGFAQSGNHEEAMKVFTNMTRAGEEANMYTYGSAISAAANLAHVKLGKQIHGRTVQTGHNSETEVCNVLVTLYAKCGCLNDAKRVFIEMPQKNEISWNSMITGYSQHGHGRKAIELFDDMNILELKRNHITYIGVLTACSHVGLVEEGLSYFKSMSEQHGLVPKQEHYACVVDILGRAGQLSRAKAFVQSMPIKPDAMIWRTFLSACTVHKNREFGEVAAKHLLELEPDHSATYVLMSNMYAVTGEWDHRDRTRLLMRDRGVKKEAGRSWIEVRNTVHAFFVGDRLHPLVDEIYNYLDELTKKVAAIGYVPDQSCLWNEVELRQKDPTAQIHSERLAVAFGLLSLPDIIPLHVMKNLRVCNDCHNWIKFISKVVDRPIIVRDAYRFHHFQDGSCSCKDYW